MVTKSVIMGAIVLTLVNSSIAYGSGLGMGDFVGHEEAVCMTYGDREEMKDLCDWINACDDNGSVNSTHPFCTGEQVRNIPYPPGGCPEGYHGEEGDEDGLCHSNEKECPDDDVFTTDMQYCIDGDTCERNDNILPYNQRCVSKELYCFTGDLQNRGIRDDCFSNEDRCMPQLNGSRCTNADVEAEFDLDLSKLVPWKGIDCDAEPHDLLCTEENGEDGFVYCDIKNRFPDPIYMYCVDRFSPDIYCEKGYHIEKFDEGIPLCVTDTNCHEGMYLNIFDKCVNPEVCNEDPEPYYDCNSLFRDKPKILPADCNALPDHPYCNGKRGQDGIVFCSLKTNQTTSSCYDDEDFDDENDPLIYCATEPETKERCKID